MTLAGWLVLQQELPRRAHFVAEMKVDIFNIEGGANASIGLVRLKLARYGYESTALMEGWKRTQLSVGFLRAGGLQNLRWSKIVKSRLWISELICASIH